MILWHHQKLLCLSEHLKKAQHSDSDSLQPSEIGTGLSDLRVENWLNYSLFLQFHQHLDI